MFNQNRKNLLRTTMAAWLLLLIWLLPGCRLLGEDTPSAVPETAPEVATAAVEEEPSDTKVAVAPTSLPVEEPTSTTAPTPVPTIEPTAEPTIDPTPEEEPTATSTPLLLPTATPTESSVAATPTAESVAVQLEILVATLRIRAGPSTDFEIISVGKDGELFDIAGRTADCEWMQIRFGADELGWVSSDFVVYPGSCEQFAIADDAPDPTAEATALASDETPVADAPTPTSVPAAGDTVPAAGEDLLPSNEGCYLFQVRLDDTVDVTFTSQDRDWETTFTLQPNEDQVYCLEPGKYAFRLVAPAPWDEYSDELEVDAGDRYLFPIRPLE